MAPKDVRALIFRICEYVTLNDKKDVFFPTTINLRFWHGKIILYYPDGLTVVLRVTMLL